MQHKSKSYLFCTHFFVFILLLLLLLVTCDANLLCQTRHTGANVNGMRKYVKTLLQQFQYRCVYVCMSVCVCVSLVKGQLSYELGGMAKYNLLLSCAFVGRKKDLLSPTLLPPFASADPFAVTYYSCCC